MYLPWAPALSIGRGLPRSALKSSGTATVARHIPVIQGYRVDYRQNEVYHWTIGGTPKNEVSV